MATFLICFLLGLGYNAYVVSGYASREICQCDQSLVNCPYLPPPPEPPPPPPPPVFNKYRPTSPPDLSSQFYKRLEEREKRRVQEELKHQNEEHLRLIVEFEKPKHDSLFGLRIHAWILLLPEGLGPRALEVTEPMFIEPTTGVSYSLSDSKTDNLYLGIESLWNNQNYWVNMQDCVEGCRKINWDLSNVSKWEHLLAGEPPNLRNVEDDLEDPLANLRRDFHLTMPVYIDSIEISEEDYDHRFPNRTKIMYFKKAKIQLFSPFLRVDGMIESITTYDDYEYKIPLYIYDKYQERSDKLERTETDLTKKIIIDYYKKGRKDACKSHQYFINDNNAVDEERTLEFYNEKRFDELLRFKMHPLYSSQNYVNHGERLYNRFVEYSAFDDDKQPNDIHYRTIVKIIEKFYRNENIPPSRNIASREFDFANNEIRIVYHYNPGQCSQGTRSFTKPPKTERGDNLVFLPHMTRFYNPDPLATPEDFDDIVELLEKLLIAEDNATILIRKGESEIHTFLQSRKMEYNNPILRISPFDPIRNDEAKAALHNLEVQRKIKSQQAIKGECNLLSPYMARLGDLKYLTNKQAAQMRQDCIEDFKQTSVNRANHMKRDYDKCSKELEKLQTILTQSEDLSKEEKEKLFESNNAMTLKLRALEIRLNRHREQATKRYHKLLGVLQNEQQLSILYE